MATKKIKELVVVSPSAPASSVDEAIAACKAFEHEGTGKRGAMHLALAVALGDEYDSIGKKGEVIAWHMGRNPNRAIVKEKEVAFKADMVAEGLATGTATTYWNNVKKLGGHIPKDGAFGARAKGAVTVDERNITDIKTVLNRIENTPEDSAPLSHKAIEMLVRAADLMGIDVAAYAIGQEVDLES